MPPCPPPPPGPPPRPPVARLSTRQQYRRVGRPAPTAPARPTGSPDAAAVGRAKRPCSAAPSNRQPSAVSRQPSAVSRQPSAVSRQPSALITTNPPLRITHHASRTTNHSPTRNTQDATPPHRLAQFCPSKVILYINTYAKTGRVPPCQLRPLRPGRHYPRLAKEKAFVVEWRC